MSTHVCARHSQKDKNSAQPFYESDLQYARQCHSKMHFQGKKQNIKTDVATDYLTT